MNIDDLTIKQARKIAAIWNQQQDHRPSVDNEMIDDYVIVRCKDAGVHAGWLVSYSGREAVLNDARRLWYWKPNNGAKFLSGVAVHGLHDDSKIGEPIYVHLTETCEIIRCTDVAAKSISEMKSDEN